MVKRGQMGSSGVKQDQARPNWAKKAKCAQRGQNIQTGPNEVKWDWYVASRHIFLRKKESYLATDKHKQSYEDFVDSKNLDDIKKFLWQLPEKVQSF